MRTIGMQDWINGHMSPVDRLKRQRDELDERRLQRIRDRVDAEHAERLRQEIRDMGEKPVA